MRKYTNEKEEEIIKIKKLKEQQETQYAEEIKRKEKKFLK